MKKLQTKNKYVKVLGMNFLLLLVFFQYFNASCLKQPKENNVTIEIEKDNVKKLKTSFDNGDWYIKYVKGIPTKMVVQYCQDAYKSYLQEILMTYLYSINKISCEALVEQNKDTNHKCNLCLAAINVSEDPKFYQLHGHKFMIKKDNNA